MESGDQRDRQTDVEDERDVYVCKRRMLAAEEGQRDEQTEGSMETDRTATKT